MNIAHVRWRKGLLRARILAVEIAGVAGIAIGTWMVYEPAAFIIGGVGAILWSMGAVQDGNPGDNDTRRTR